MTPYSIAILAEIEGNLIKRPEMHAIGWYILARLSGNNLSDFMEACALAREANVNGRNVTEFQIGVLRAVGHHEVAQSLLASLELAA